MPGGRVDDLPAMSKGEVSQATSRNGQTADVGEVIKVRRKQWGMSQFGLGAEVGVSQRKISRWERNEYAPNLKEARKLKLAIGGKAADYCAPA